MKNKLLWLTTVLSVIFVFAFCINSVSAKTYGGEFDSSTKDPNKNPYTCVWIFDEESATLCIEGYGDLPEMTASDAPWQNYKDKIVNLEVDEGITALGKLNFKSCTALKNVKLPESLKYIRMRCFEDCTALESITIPETVIDVGDQTFRNCTSLKTAVFEAGIASLGCYMFGNCKSLEDVYVYGMDTVISRMYSNNIDGVWFRDCDFDKLTAHCYEGSDAEDYFVNDIYTITNWSKDKATGAEVEQTWTKQPNWMTANGKELKVEYITE